MDLKQIKSDVIIVGSGAAAAILAKDLTQNGKKVVIVEKGGNYKPNGHLFSGLTRYLGGKKALGTGILLTPELLIMLRGVSVGGTTLMYTGTAYPPPFKEFDKNYGISLEKEVKQIKKEFSVSQIPDDLMGNSSMSIKKSANDLGYDWKLFEKFIQTEKCQKHCNKCFYGCKHKAKWQAYDLIEEAVKLGTRLITNAECEKVLNDGKNATGIVIKKNKKRYELKSKIVILSAGGIGSPTILQNSGLFEAGKNFFIDPFILTLGYVKTSKKNITSVPMSAGLHLEKEGIMISDLSLPTGMVKTFETISMKVKKNPLKNRPICLLTQVSDSKGGLIHKDGKVVKKLDLDDLDKLNQGRIISKSILSNMGIEDILHTPVSAAHPGGTCSIGNVVDSNLQTRIKNLFISDSSILPESWGIPPVLTIMALSRRLSNHITAKL